MQENANYQEPVHDFHLKMSEDQLAKLKSVCCSFGIMRISELIAFLIEKFNALLETEHLLAAENDGGYDLINSDLEIKRKSIHVNIPRVLFRRLKMVHQDLNFFSIAQIVRKIVGRVIELADRLGNGLLFHLNKLQMEWEKTKEKYRKSKKPIRNQQLSNSYLKSHPKKSQFALKSIYNYNYAPIFIYLC